VIVYSIGLIQPDEFRTIRAVRRMEFRWALFAFAGVVVLGTLKGILVAVVLSLASLAHQVADPPVYVLGRKRGHQRVPPALGRASRRRGVSGALDAARRGARVLRECRAHWTEDAPV
jgi:MFS superfamily sulfate permease-like transporter